VIIYKWKKKRKEFDYLKSQVGGLLLGVARWDARM
jgi:hypothetical protein